MRLSGSGIDSARTRTTTHRTPGIWGIRTITLHMALLTASHTLPFKRAILGLMRPLTNIARNRHSPVPGLTKMVINMQRARDGARTRHTNNPGTIHNIIQVSPSSEANIVYLPLLRKFLPQRSRVRLEGIAKNQNILRSRPTPPPT